jgi:hypothetical protein
MNRTLTAVLLLTAGLVGLIFSTGSASAVGPPSDNLTFPESPLKDTHEMIKPPTEPVLDTISALPKSPPPAVSLEFIGPEEADNYRVVGDGNWYLHMDINTPGWLYIYEELPPGRDMPGRWLAYKWKLLQEGRWRLGPFSASAGEPEGKHTYRAWFYGDNQWAAQPAQNSSVTWTYLRSQPAVKPPETSTAPPVKQETPPVKTETPPVKGDTPRDQFFNFITNPIVLVFGPPVLVLIVFFTILLMRAYRKRARALAAAGVSHPATGGEPALLEVPETASYPEPALQAAPIIESGTAGIAVHASLSLPNGGEIRLSGGAREIGRSDLARAAGLDELGLISRKHFRITNDGEHFYIEDTGSANGTHLNGEDIAGKEPRELKDNDSIELPGAIRIRFHLV